MIITLGPWELVLVSLSHDVKHALDTVTYPYLDGSETIDMGVDGFSYRFECELLNDQFDSEYQAFEEWSRSRFEEPVELHHPDFGVLYGYPANFSIRRPQLRRAQISFEFVREGLQPEPQAFINIERVADAAVVQLNADVQAATAESMQQLGVPDVEGSDWSLLDKWSSMGAAARSFAAAAQKVNNTMLGAISQIQAPADAISASIDYVDSLSGSITQATQQCTESFVTAARKLNPTQSRSGTRAIIAALVADLIDMRYDLSDAPASVQSGFDTLSAAAVAREAARLIAQDEAHLSESIAAESVLTEDVEGRQISAPSSPYLLTPAELEDMLAQVRAYVQLVLNTATNADLLQHMANALTDTVRRVKLEYLNTEKVTLTHSTPLHALLLQRGLNYKAADRIAALNGVINPTFMQGEVLVYAS